MGLTTILMGLPKYGSLGFLVCIVYKNIYIYIEHAIYIVISNNNNNNNLIRLNISLYLACAEKTSPSASHPLCAPHLQRLSHATWRIIPLRIRG